MLGTRLTLTSLVISHKFKSLKVISHLSSVLRHQTQDKRAKDQITINTITFDK